jgi:hypothetical protein
MTRTWLAVLALASFSTSAWAEGPVFTQAIVIGANASVDRELPPLRYADDDAVRFADLFRAIGMRVYVLARLDEGTRGLHPDAVAEVRMPTAPELRAVVAEAAAQAAQARSRGLKTALYLVFAGHGNARKDRAYITLEDARLYPEDLLREVVEPVGADQAHVIIDACHSYLFAMSRGPGGTHRAVRGFLEGSFGARTDKVGFLISSSQSGESHEWEAFQSGVFSHEVRSGLAGAADADGDGMVSYREIAAFVVRANAAIVNEHFRPTVYARAPRGGDTLVDLRAAAGDRMRVDGKASGKHLLIEDARGVRWADFHVRQGESLKVLLPPGHRPLYVRGAEDGQESVVEAGQAEVVLADRSLRPSEAGSRGAAQHVFKSLFSLPFDRQAVDSFELQLDDEAVSAMDSRGWGARQYLGITAFTAAAAAAAGGTYYLVAGRRLYTSADPAADQKMAAQRNDTIGRYNRNAGVLYGAGAALAATGLLLFLWPSEVAGVALLPNEGGMSVAVTLRR